MRRTRAALAVLGLLVCALALESLGGRFAGPMIGDIFGEREPAIYVHNETTATFYAFTTDFPDGDGLPGEDVEPREIRGVGWSGCRTSWLLLRERKNPASDELARHELTLCSGDTVIVDPDYGITIECRERSETIRSEPDCPTSVS